MLILLGYFANNASLFTGESTLQYAFFQRICKAIGIHNEVDYGDEDVIYFNNSFDKTLIPIYKGDYDNKIQIGNKAITDRGKLLRLLNILKETDSYKFIIIDLKFDAQDSTEYDDALFESIGSMRNIVFVDHDNLPTRANLLKEKKAKAQYNVTPLITNFSRYKYLYDDGPSIPLFVYDCLNNYKGFKRFGFNPFFIYTDNGRLCQNSIFLTFDYYSFAKSELNKIDDSYYTPLLYENIGEFVERYDNSSDPSEDKMISKIAVSIRLFL